MTAGDDPRTAAVLALIPHPEQRAWAAQILQSLADLEQIDFGELEPIGVAAPHVGD